MSIYIFVCQNLSDSDCICWNWINIDRILIFNEVNLMNLIKYLLVLSFFNFIYIFTTQFKTTKNNFNFINKKIVKIIIWFIQFGVWNFVMSNNYSIYKIEWSVNLLNHRTWKTLACGCEVMHKYLTLCLPH